MAERSSFGTASLFLGWSLGLFALISGIQEVSAWNSGVSRAGRDLADLFDSSSASLSLFFAIGKIVVGLILILAPLRALHDGVARVLLVIAVLFWIAIAVVELFFWSHPFHPDVLQWLKNLSWYLILICGSWHVRNSLP